MYMLRSLAAVAVALMTMTNSTLQAVATPTQHAIAQPFVCNHSGEASQRIVNFGGHRVLSLALDSGDSGGAKISHLPASHPVVAVLATVYPASIADKMDFSLLVTNTNNETFLLKPTAERETFSTHIAGVGLSKVATIKFKVNSDNPKPEPIGTPATVVLIAAALEFIPSVLVAIGVTVTGVGAGAGFPIVTGKIDFIREPVPAVDDTCPN